MIDRRSVVFGVSWSAGGRFAKEAVQLLCTLIMARYLLPTELGIYAIVLVFFNLMNILGSAGSAQILIMKRQPTQSLVVSLFYLNMIIGAVMFGVLYLGSELVAAFFTEPQLNLLLKLVAVSFLLQSPILVQRALMEKAFQFRKLAIIEFCAVVVSSVVGMLAAAADYGVYSLLFLTLSNAAVLALLLWFGSDWRPVGCVNVSELMGVGRHALSFSGSALLNFFSRNFDTFLIGRFIGTSSLGFYTLAYRLTLYPVQAMSQVVHRVMFPALSKLSVNIDVLRDAYLKSLEGVVLLIFPLTVGLCVTAENFVSLVLGKQWQAMVPIIYVLAPLGIVQAVVATVGTVYSATQQTGLMFRMGLLNSAVVLVAIVGGLSSGIFAVALAYAAANLLMLYPNLKMCWRSLHLPVAVGLARLMPYFVCALLGGLASMGAGQLLSLSNVSPVVVLLMKFLVIVLTYPAMLWLLYRSRLNKLVLGLTSR